VLLRHMVTLNHQAVLQDANHGQFLKEEVVLIFITNIVKHH